MNNIKLWIAMVVVTIIAIGGYYNPTVQKAVTSFGAVTTDCGQTTCLTGGLRLTSGDLSVVTTNAATSSAALGCIQTVATSTATAIKLIPGSINSAATSTFTAGSNGGFLTWQYGTCP